MMGKGKGDPRCWGRVRVNLGVKGKGEPRCWGRVRVNLCAGEG